MQKNQTKQDPRLATKNALTAKLAELVQNLTSREELALTQAPDILDAIQLAQERELAIENIQRSTRTLTHIKEALVRLEDGSYGICHECDSEIADKRLAAIPWAVRCVKCEERADENDMNQIYFDWKEAA